MRRSLLERQSVVAAVAGAAPAITRRGTLRALAVLSALCWVLGGSPARAESPLDFKLKNRLGVTISSLFMSPHQADSWEEDILGANYMADGKDVMIRFGSGDEDRGDLWDLKVVTSDNQIYIWNTPGFKLRQVSEITLYLRGGQAMADSR